MDFIEIVTESFSTLTVNKMRTGLAVLGIVIGIGSVIALISLGQSSKQAIESQIQALGSNLLTVQPGAVSQGGVRGASGGRTTLTYEDAQAISSSPEITTVKAVSPEISRWSQITTAKSNTNTQVYGVTSAYASVHKIEISSGSFITQRDVDSMTKVAVVGPQVAADLFGEGINPVGQTIRIGSQTLTVVGMTDSKGGSGLMNLDDVVYVPLPTAQKQLFGQNSLNSIAIEANNPEVMVQTQDQVGYLLLRRHKLSDPSEADFSIMSQQDILDTASAMTGTFTSLLSGIAAISLLVGGIGIMNIMLVTVTERTREIGLRKALGARRKDITAQFLIESIILTFAGGAFGVILGIIVSYFISRIVNTVFLISPRSVLLAFAVSTGIGILFGWYPARKASNMQPIEALRYE